MKANEVFDDAAMSDKDLEELLRLELEREDPALTLQVLESLSCRQPEKPGEAEAAWQRERQKRCRPKKQRKRKNKKR